MTQDEARRRWREALEIELLPEQTGDDRDDAAAGWGDRARTTRPSQPGSVDPDVQRYLDDKPPHHGG